MVTHVVQCGESLYAIARRYGIPLSLIMAYNRLPDPNRIAIGQALVIRFPRQLHTVRPGETLFAISERYGVSLQELYRNNPVLGGSPTIYPGQALVISFEDANKNEPTL